MSSSMKFTNDDVLKLKAIVLYIINRCGTIDMYRILKIVYFANREHFAKWGIRLTNDTFIAMENGPVASRLYDAFKDVIRKGNHIPKSDELKIVSSCLYNAEDAPYYFSSKEMPDMDELSDSNIKCLEDSISEHSKESFDTLKSKSHDIAWESAYISAHNSPIDSLLIAKAGGANEATVEYIKEMNAIKSVLCC